MKSLYNRFVHYLYYTVMSICMVLYAIIIITGIYIVILERIGK
jgi:hypothetical protein